MAVIGAGPAGFYTAYRVQSKLPDAKIDMYEALPVPYGLVRFGVAPDHPEVKNCQDKFAEVALHPNFTYVGNCPIGDTPGSLPLPLLASHYDALVLSYGASKDRKLNVPGEDTLGGIYSARDFVGWYNGLPEHRDLNPDLQADEGAVVIGHGNVALDVARMLLCPVERLTRTDITEYALEALARSRVRRVRVVGRRGPMQAAFTIKELRELFTLPNVSFHPIPSSLLPPPESISAFPRAQKRILQMLHQHSSASSLPSSSTNPTTSKSWSLDFLLSPTAFFSLPTNSTCLSSIEFRCTTLSGPDPYSPTCPVSPTTETMTFPTSLAFKSIGYLSLPLPGASSLGIPFNPKLGLIPNEGGRVVIPVETGPPDFVETGTIRVPGVYVSGWVKRGPTGVIASTMYDAFETGDAVIEDWVGGGEGSGGKSVEFMEFGGAGTGEERRGWEAMEGIAKERGIRRVSWEEWRKIEEAEKQRGKRGGKEREKFARVEEMLGVLE
ncbi:hypothetical protein BDZ91DRAFT_648670 [Kalaharituber pfeilii]|nr:hypothetical protein BDZ91DRAFT_648670 [Kalaharituber pfeilii]